MDTVDIKADILKLVNLIDDESFLHAIRILLLKQIPGSNTKDFWDELPSRVQKEIENSILEADRGELFSTEVVMKEIRSEYLKV